MIYGDILKYKKAPALEREISELCNMARPS